MVKIEKEINTFNYQYTLLSAEEKLNPNFETSNL